MHVWSQSLERIQVDGYTLRPSQSRICQSSHTLFPAPHTFRVAPRACPMTRVSRPSSARTCRHRFHRECIHRPVTMQPEAMVPVACWRLPHCQAYWGPASLVANRARFPMILLGQVARLIDNIRQKSAPVPLQQSQRKRSDPIPRQPTGIAVSLQKLLDPNLLASCRMLQPPSRTLPLSRSLDRSHVASEAIPRKTPGRATRLPNYREQMNRPLLFATGKNPVAIDQRECFFANIQSHPPFRRSTVRPSPSQPAFPRKPLCTRVLSALRNRKMFTNL